MLTAYLQEESVELKNSRKRKAVIVCPGGGYAFCSDREAEVIALNFMAKGIQGFVLDYSVATAVFPSALTELAAAVATVRTHADAWNVDKDQIFVCGFSAGGHLAASIGTLWQEDFLKEQLREQFGEDNTLWKPNGMILSYPVITLGAFTHEGSRNNLLRGQMTEEMIEKLSLENRVTEHTPPAFLWHTVADNAVPVENSLQFAMALQRQGISYEMHLFEKGCHGLALCNSETEASPETLVPDNECWFDMAVRWLKRQ